jgi:hypothetical protein
MLEMNTHSNSVSAERSPHLWDNWLSQRLPGWHPSFKLNVTRDKHPGMKHTQSIGSVT